jgi:ribosomal protein L11 methyltransferase
MPAAWQQLHIDLDGLDADTVEVLVIELGAVSVTYSDAADDPVLEPAPSETPLWRHTRLTALFDGASDLDAVVTTLTTRLGLAAPLGWQREMLEDRDWEREWLKDFGPMRFGKRLWVCPEDSTVGDSDAVVVRLDPGLAFGTGTHPTTALCLEWLDSLDLDGRTLIDYGAGSGILAIAAVKLGAKHAYAYDIDPQAVIASRANAERNGVTDQVEATIRTADIAYPADVVIANILAGPLIKLATEILDLTITGGKLALSGILSEQVTEVAEAYAERARFDKPVVLEQDGQTWARLTGIRL